MGDVADQKRRAFWLKHLHQWHWVSAAICLIAMLLFSITGITLNHASQIAAKPTVTKGEAKLPPPILAALKVDAGADAKADKAPLPTIVNDWIDETLSVETAGRIGEWSEDEVYVSMPRPGGDAWLSIDRATGDIQYERTDRGTISWLNDLHKGRNAGPMWGWFIDVFAVACVLFASTGLLLLKMHASRRPGTWPYVALGLVIPVVVIVLFVH
jgi:uncharacterized protein